MLIGQEFHLNKYHWVVKVFYIIDNPPVEYLRVQLLQFNKEDVAEAIDNITFSKDTGFTFTDNSDGFTIIVIAPTTSPEEFQSTFDHEKLHLAMHIAKKYDIDPFSEELAYLVGEIGLQMFPIAKRFLCEHCRQEFE